MGSSLTLGGLVSGLSTDDVIQKLLDAESVSKNREVAKQTALQAKQASWQKVKTQLQTLRTKLDAIRMSSGFQQRAVTVSDDQYVTARATAGATITDHSLSITSIATAHSVVGESSMSSTTTALGLSGVITIQTAKDATPYRHARRHRDPHGPA
jgi:flagellar hook-associated protein 2